MRVRLIAGEREISIEVEAGPDQVEPMIHMAVAALRMVEGSPGGPKEANPHDRPGERTQVIPMKGGTVTAAPLTETRRMPAPGVAKVDPPIASDLNRRYLWPDNK